ncbi:MAG TPA: hypothetical protein VKT18_02030, partial [Acidimicrobiales bacterium]|nr:hypothetical protein [Acidimicrobiales bacterium]
HDELVDELRRQVAAAAIHPVLVGSALTGAGCSLLMAAVPALLPVAPGRPDAPPSGRVFKVERSDVAGKLAYVRMHEGTLRVRDAVRVGAQTRPITAIDVFAGAPAVPKRSVVAGEIGRLAGLAEVRVGDWLGTPAPGSTFHFPLPALEAVVEPVDPSAGPALRAALGLLADQDPLIDVRLEDDGRLSVSLYGEVQKEVLASTLELDFGIAVTFRETTPVCVERPARTARAVELLRDTANPISATVGVEVRPLEPGAGVRVAVGIESRRTPLHIYKTHDAFAAAIREHVVGALEVGPHGWRVTDCLVTLTDCDYYTGDGRVPPGTTKTSAADFRRLTPVVVAAALARAGTVVCEPVARARLEVPSTSLPATIALVTRLGGRLGPPAVDGATAVLEVLVAAARAAALQRELTATTHGEGVCETEVVGYAPAAAPTRRRSSRGS